MCGASALFAIGLLGIWLARRLAGSGLRWFVRWRRNRAFVLAGLGRRELAFLTFEESRRLELVVSVRAARLGSIALHGVRWLRAHLSLREWVPFDVTNRAVMR